jgi:hypothetical protein
MSGFKSTWMLLLGVALLIVTPTTAQQGSSDQADAEEEYVKRNTALTAFSRLGVSQKQYVKTVKSVNTLDPVKTLKLVQIGKEEFRDDGQGFDQVANDGILSCTTANFYVAGEAIIPVGEYLAAREEVLVHDESFDLTLAGRWPWLPTITVNCKFRWKKCNEFPHPISQICYDLGPPYGTLVVYDCHFGLSWF